MAGELPTGTVTFLFTDVESSTRLLEELGPERFAAELERHRVVVRDALAAHGGAEVDTQGDAFFCAFPSARAAVACAERIQATLDGGFPMVGVELARGRRDAALGHCRAMLDPSQQPLPPELGALAEAAVAAGDRASLARALEAATALGYA